MYGKHEHHPVVSALPAGFRYIVFFGICQIGGSCKGSTARTTSGAGLFPDLFPERICWETGQTIPHTERGGQTPQGASGVTMERGGQIVHLPEACDH